MLKKALLALAMMLVASNAFALQPIPGDYELDWAILHSPVSSDLPTLEAGTKAIRLEDAAGRCVRPTSAFIVLNAPASHIQGGTVTWCLTADGAFEESPSGPIFSGSWFQYTDTHAIIRVEQGTRSNDEVMAVAIRQTSPPPPPPSPVKVFITQPRASQTVSGTVWVVLWAEETSGSSNLFTLKVDGRDIATQNAGSSRGPVTIPWRTTSADNGTHTITGVVRDATGAAGNSSISVIVRNP